jgi:hypothetical protein
MCCQFGISVTCYHFESQLDSAKIELRILGAYEDFHFTTGMLIHTACQSLFEGLKADSM